MSSGWLEFSGTILCVFGIAAVILGLLHSRAVRWIAVVLMAHADVLDMIREEFPRAIRMWRRELRPERRELLRREETL